MRISAKPIIMAPPGLHHLLLKKYPGLSPTELKVSTLLSLNLTSNDIAGITGRSVRTIEYTRNNIRKKMGLNPGDNLINHLILLTSKG